MAGREAEIATDVIEVDMTPQVNQRVCTLSEKARQNQAQLENVNATAARTSKRALKATSGGPTEGVNPGLSLGDVSGWQKVLEVVGKSHEEISKLTQIILQQQDIIKNLEKYA
ncbi:hypothetical protein B7463_g5128, partial [Scytalidium lignicola]